MCPVLLTAKCVLFCFTHDTMLIRDMPDEIHARLVAEAEQNRRSTEKHALYLIEGGLLNRRPLAERQAAAKRIQAQFKREVTMKEIIAATKEDY